MFCSKPKPKALLQNSDLFFSQINLYIIHVIPIKAMKPFCRQYKIYILSAKFYYSNWDWFILHYYLQEALKFNLHDLNLNPQPRVSEVKFKYHNAAGLIQNLSWFLNWHFFHQMLNLSCLFHFYYYWVHFNIFLFQYQTNFFIVDDDVCISIQNAII